MQQISQVGTVFPAKKVFSGAFLVMGTAVGAGMLGIPAMTAAAGFVPAVVITLLVWAFMLATGLLLLEVTLKMPAGSNIFSISQKYLGKKGTWLVSGMFLFLYYCLVTAYIAGGSPFLSWAWDLMGLNWTSVHYVFFTFLAALIVYYGIKMVDRINIAMNIAMLFAYLSMFVGGTSAISSHRLFETASFGTAFWAIPILFGAFGYHNIIPTLSDYLNRDRRALIWSLVLGTFASALIYLAWQFLVIGSVDASVLKIAMEKGQTSVSALQEASGHASLYIFGKWFGALALFTSLLGVSLSMVDFCSDGCSQMGRAPSRAILCALVFGPPLFFTICNPEIFMTALGLAGGIGESFLNALLPIAVVWISRYTLKQSGYEIPIDKKTLVFFFVLAVCVMGIEIAALIGIPK